MVFRNDKWISGKVVKKVDSLRSYWIKIGGKYNDDEYLAIKIITKRYGKCDE